MQAVDSAVLRSWAETAELQGLRLDAGPLSSFHVRPGQYVDVLGSPFALANAPGAPELELLVKRGTETPDRLAGLAEGAKVTVSRPMGAGFPVDDFVAYDVVLAAAGTGIAPIRGTLAHMLPQRERWGQLTLFYGQRRDADFAYRREHDAWRAAGVDLKLVRSSDAEMRYVQDAIRHAPVFTRPTVAFVCGMPEMTEAVIHALAGRGLSRGLAFLNL